MTVPERSEDDQPWQLTIAEAVLVSECEAYLGRALDLTTSADLMLLRCFLFIDGARE